MGDMWKEQNPRKTLSSALHAASDAKSEICGTRGCSTLEQLVLHKGALSSLSSAAANREQL